MVIGCRMRKAGVRIQETGEGGRMHDAGYRMQETGDRRPKTEDRIIGPFRLKKLTRPQAVRFSERFRF